MKKKFDISKFNDRVDFTEYEPLTPMEAIKAYCKECYCWDVKEMKQCDSNKCPFNQFLKNNFKTKTRNLSEEVRQKLAENMRNIRKNME